MNRLHPLAPHACVATVEMLLIPWACTFVASEFKADKGVYHSSASPHFSDLSVSSLRLWLPFLDVIRALYSVWGRVCCCHCQLCSSSWWIWCLLAIWCVGRMMWLALSARILLGCSPSPAPCQNENTLPVFHHLMWKELHAAHASVGSSRHIWCCSCQCQCFESGSKVLSVKTVLLTIFAHWGWNTSSLIGSHFYIVIFRWETLVAKQFRNREKFKAFMLIRHTWLEMYFTLTVRASDVW